MNAADDAALPPGTTAAVIGGGPAGLMAAEVLARGGAAVTVYDQMPSLGRKFLMAGRGGLNLTHGEALPDFLTRYGDLPPLLRRAIEAFPPDACAAGARGSASRPLSARADACFRPASRRRLCCAPGCAV